MNSTYSEKQITAIGGKPWARGDKYRVYINDWASLAGIEVSHYKSGNVCYCAVDGQEVANSRAGQILGAVQSVYWDSSDGKIHVQANGGTVDVRLKKGGRVTINLVERIRSGITEAVRKKGGDA